MNDPQKSPGYFNESALQGRTKGPRKIRAAWITAGTSVVVALLYILSSHLWVGKHAVTFTGEVHDDAGVPVPGARVSVTQDEATPEVVYSDDGGAFHVKLRPDVSAVHVTVLAKGFVPLTRDAQPERSGPEELVLERMPAAPAPAAPPLAGARIETHGRGSPVVIGNGNDVRVGPK